MFSDNMKPDTRWWIGPASPQWGRSTKVWKPRRLGPTNQSRCQNKKWTGFIFESLFVVIKGRYKNLCFSLPPQVVQYGHVDIGVVEVVWVRRVVLFGPVRWQRTVKIENVMLRFGLVVDAVEAHHLRKAGNMNRRSTLSPGVGRGDVLDFLWGDTLTCSRKRCSSGWLRGLMVTSNRGMKIFSNISWKLASCFFVWYTSLQKWVWNNKCH